MFFCFPRSPQGAIRDVLVNRRASASVRPVADIERRDERSVDSGLHALSELRAVLPAAVVVGGDDAGAQVAVLTDVRVADVRQVRHLRAGADVGVLDLHEGPHLRALADDRAGAQICEGTDLGVGAHLGIHEVGVEHGRAVAVRGVARGGAGRPRSPRR